VRTPGGSVATAAIATSRYWMPPVFWHFTARVLAFDAIASRALPITT